MKKKRNKDHPPTRASYQVIFFISKFPKKREEAFSSSLSSLIFLHLATTKALACHENEVS
jgi:hypothetical protein